MRGLVVLIGALLVAACDADAPPADTAQSPPYAQARQLLYDGKTRYELPKATELLETVVADDPANLAAKLDLAYVYARRSKFEDAARQISEIKENYDKLTDSQKMWTDGIGAWADDDRAGTVAAFEAIVTAEPNNRWAWYQLASATSWAGDYAASAKAAARAAQVEPEAAKWESSWLYYLHSKALYRSGQYGPAIAAATQGEGNQTTWRSTFYRRALAQVKAGQADPADLMDEYIQISNAEGRNNPAYTDANIALFYFELGDYRAAADFARKAWGVEKTSYFYWTLLYSLTEGGQLGEAKSLMESVDGKFAENASARAAEGWALYRLGALKEASAALDEAEAVAKRWQIQIEHNKAAVKAALKDVNAPPAPPIPWLG